MSTQKTFANLGQSRVASHAAVKRRRPYKEEPLPFDRRTLPSISHNRKPAEFPSLGTPLSNIGARDDPGSVRIEVREILDCERLLIETRHGKEVTEPSVVVFDSLLHATREMAKEAGPRTQQVVTPTIQLLPSWCAHGIEAGKN